MTNHKRTDDEWADMYAAHDRAQHAQWTDTQPASVARSLLAEINAYDAPVEFHHFECLFNPAVPPLEAEDEDELEERRPDWAAWMARKEWLFGVRVALHDTELIQVTYPANGYRPDLIEITEAGRLFARGEDVGVNDVFEAVGSGPLPHASAVAEVAPPGGE